MINTWFKNPLYGILTLSFLVFVGLLAIVNLPVSLLPEIKRLELTIETTWPGHSAEEVLSKIVQPQEKELRGVPNLYEITSLAFPGLAEITMTFNYGTSLDDAYTYAQQSINRVRSRPLDALPSVIEKTGEMQRLAFVFIQSIDGSGRAIDTYQKEIEELILPAVQAVDGVSHIKLFLASEEEMQIKVDINKLAAYEISLQQLIAQVRHNQDLSLGRLRIGKHNYLLQYEGRFDLEALRAKPILSPVAGSVPLGEVAEVKYGRSDRRHYVMQNGSPAIGIDISKAENTNLLASLDALYAEIQRLNEDVLKDHGLYIEKSFDPTVFIYRALRLILSNLFLGSILSALGLFIFIKDTRLIVILFLTIPATLFAVLFSLYVLNYSLNVISLAAIALSTGVILDAAIVVMDAIRSRYRETGAILPAITDGLNKVGKVLLSSTLTSVVIFVPILLIESFEGQLFKDLALTISLAIGFSFLVSVFLFPLIFYFKPQWLESNKRERWVSQLAEVLSRFCIRYARRPWFVASVFIATVVAFQVLLPGLDLLPTVKRDTVDNQLLLPEGQDLQVLEEELGELVKARLQPYLDKTKSPHVKDYYLAISPEFTSLGVRPVDKEDTDRLKKVLREEILADIPGLEVITYQAGIFRRLRGSRTLSLNIFSENSAVLHEAATEAKKRLQQRYADIEVRVTPSTESSVPQIIMTPDFDRMGFYGIPEQQVIDILQTAGNGLFVGQVNQNGRLLDVRIKLASFEYLDDLLALPVSARGVLLKDVVRVGTDSSFFQLRRVDFLRAVTLLINVPEGHSVEAFSELVGGVARELNDGVLKNKGHADLSGASDILAQAIHNLLINLLFAVIVFFAILLLIFRRLLYCLIILFSLPVAAVGSLLALKAMSLFYTQQLDVLTMIGFLILVGLIINNAILFVDAYLSSPADSPEAAVQEAFNTRLLPILMSTMTSIIGILPLALIPGAGNELYRGLGVVLVGGMSVGGLILLILIPGLLLLTSRWRMRVSLAPARVETGSSR